MSDYMRGYDNRNRRRRAAYSSSGRSAYKRRQKNRRGRSRLFFYLTRGGVIVAAILLVAFGVRAALGLVGEAGACQDGRQCRYRSGCFSICCDTGTWWRGRSGS